MRFGVRLLDGALDVLKTFVTPVRGERRQAAALQIEQSSNARALPRIFIPGHRLFCPEIGLTLRIYS